MAAILKNVEQYYDSTGKGDLKEQLLIVHLLLE